jgi:hypothetical protein
MTAREFVADRLPSCDICSLSKYRFAVEFHCVIKLTPKVTYSGGTAIGFFPVR